MIPSNIAGRSAVLCINRNWPLVPTIYKQCISNGGRKLQETSAYVRVPLIARTAVEFGAACVHEIKHRSLVTTVLSSSTS
jgi:hypothetical protein